jgi:Carboxypeptidase regulatory-like domain/FlgD Ig-like domain
MRFIISFAILATIFLVPAGLRAQTISGTVIDAITKAPVKGAKVTVVEVKKEYATDSAGTFTTDTLDKGDYSVRFESESYLKQTKTVKLVGLKGATGKANIILDVLLFSLSSNADQAKGQMAIKYYFPGHSDVSIDVCDPSGKVVRTVWDRSRTGGSKAFAWDGTDNKGKLLPAGTYTCKITCGNLFTSRNLVWNGEVKK